MVKGQIPVKFQVYNINYNKNGIFKINLLTVVMKL